MLPCTFFGKRSQCETVTWMPRIVLWNVMCVSVCCLSAASVQIVWPNLAWKPSTIWHHNMVSCWCLLNCIFRFVTPIHKPGSMANRYRQFEQHTMVDTDARVYYGGHDLVCLHMIILQGVVWCTTSVILPDGCRSRFFSKLLVSSQSKQLTILLRRWTSKCYRFSYASLGFSCFWFWTFSCYCILQGRQTVWNLCIECFINLVPCIPTVVLIFSASIKNKKFFCEWKIINFHND